MVHLGANDLGKVYSEDLKNRYRILGKRLKAKGCDIMFSGILTILGNGIEFMSRLMDVSLWLEEWCREEAFALKKNRNGATRFAVGIEEGIQAFLG